jgi:hypothetical protein
LQGCAKRAVAVTNSDADVEHEGKKGKIDLWLDRNELERNG